MWERIKLYLGLGPAEAYPTRSKLQRAVLLVVQITFVALIVMADSWPTRALAFIALVAAMWFVAVLSGSRAA